MTNEQYYEFIQPYEDAKQLLLTKLDVMNHNLYHNATGKPIHHIQFRVKQKKSMEEKLQRMNLAQSLKNAKDYLQDIAGIRVICYFVDDIYNLSKVIKKQQDLIVIKERDYIKEPKQNGYRSYHLVLGIPVCCLDGTEYFPVEVQFRTLSMDTWASMEHRICYKKEREDKEAVEKELLRYADTLQKLEDSFERYHEVMEENT